MLFLALWLPVAASAAEAPALAVSPLAATGKVAFFLVLVLALILVLAWLSRKTRIGQWPQTGGASVPMKALSTLNLGLKEKLVVVEVGERRLLLGVTPQQITTLAELERDTENRSGNSSSSPATSVGTDSGFAELLKKTLIRQ